MWCRGVGPSWWIFHEKKLQAFGPIYGHAPGIAFGLSRQADTWKGGARGLKMGSTKLGNRQTPGQLCSHQFSSRWLPGGSESGYGGVCGVSIMLSRGCGPLDPHACSWLVESVLLWIDEVSWTRGRLCGSTSPRGLVWVSPSPHDV
jgi:hypothetical protein